MNGLFLKWIPISFGTVFSLLQHSDETQASGAGSWVLIPVLSVLAGQLLNFFVSEFLHL